MAAPRFRNFCDVTRTDTISPIAQSSKPYAFSFANNRGGWSESKALDKSVDKIPTTLLLSIASFQSSISFDLVIICDSLLRGFLTHKLVKWGELLLQHCFLSFFRLCILFAIVNYKASNFHFHHVPIKSFVLQIVVFLFVLGNFLFFSYPATNSAKWVRVKGSAFQMKVIVSPRNKSTLNFEQYWTMKIKNGWPFVLLGEMH